MTSPKPLIGLMLSCALALLMACGGGGGETPPTVPSAPTITIQPSSTVAIAGHAATFAVTASGSGTLSYQWKKNGANIPGANANAYTTPTTAATDDGAVFCVVVSSGTEHVTSGNATLAVITDTGGRMLFVAPGGNDGITYEQNAVDHPWQSVAQAWSQARSGDTVFFRAGTYSVRQTIGSKYLGYDGTAEQPVTFRNYPGEAATISGHGSDVGGSLFVVERTYYHIQGLSFEGNGFTAEGAIFFVGYDREATGFSVVNSNFKITSTLSNDNVSAVGFRTKQADAVVRDCTFEGPGSVGGILLFRSRNCLLEHNVFRNWDKGIYFKHSNTLDAAGASTLSRNLFLNCTTGIQSVANYALMEHNLLVGCPITLGVDGGIGDGWVGADYNTIRHNTLFNNQLELAYENRPEDPNKGCLHNTIQDNVFMKTCEWHAYADIAADLRSDYNLFVSGNAVVENRLGYSLSAWQTLHGGDAHSLAGTPLFEGGASPSSTAGFKLSATSPGHLAASDGTDMGANVDLVPSM